MHVLTLEVGARGFVARSTFSFLKKIGFSPAEARFTCRQTSEVVARCSYAICLRANEKRWNSSRTLLVPNSCKEPILEVDSSLRAEGKSPLLGLNTQTIVARVWRRQPPMPFNKSD